MEIALHDILRLSYILRHIFILETQWQATVERWLAYLVWLRKVTGDYVSLQSCQGPITSSLIQGIPNASVFLLIGLGIRNLLHWKERSHMYGLKQVFSKQLIQNQDLIPRKGSDKSYSAPSGLNFERLMFKSGLQSQKKTGVQANKQDQTPSLKVSCT